MRLTQSEVVAIKAAAAVTYGPSAVVRLFGSRIHDELRGGDIDLHLEVDDTTDDLRQRFVQALYRAIGERSIDVLISRRGSDLGQVESKALRMGVVL